MRAERVQKSGAKASIVKVTEKVNDLESCANPSSDEKQEIARDSSHSEEGDLFDIVSFRKENFVQSWCQREEQYDTILW